MGVADKNKKEDLFYSQYKNKIIRKLLLVTMSQKETDFINKEIDYYCLFEKYNTQDIYDLINNRINGAKSLSLMIYIKSMANHCGGMIYFKISNLIYKRMNGAKSLPFTCN